MPPHDATAIARLQAAGSILLGKLNMMEIGFGPTLHPPFGVARNPCDLGRTTGGSSSGSASAVAARLAPATLGADTGGSVRLPASFCGVVGLKPTWGRVSRYGLMGICARFDCVGPLARGQEMDVLPRRRLLSASLIPASIASRRNPFADGSRRPTKCCRA